MPAWDIPKSYSNGNAYTEAMVDECMEYVEGQMNTTKLDSDNIQTGGIATANIADSAVTAAKLASDAVTTVKILDANVTTAKLAANAVTRAKIESVGQQVSSSSGSFSTSSAAYADVTNLSVSITTSGRPVFLLIVSDGTSSVSQIAGSSIGLRFMRGATDIGSWEYGTSAAFGNFSALDIPAAGTYTYKVQVKNGGGGSTVAQYLKLVAFEL
jgi:hypothetical protein